MRSKNTFLSSDCGRTIVAGFLFALAVLWAGAGVASAADKGEKIKPWWNPEWTIRKKITVDTTAAGGNITEPVGAATAVLLRLSDNNFQFDAESAHDDGSGLRFVADDDKTVLPYQIEKIDSLLHEAYVWVKVPEIKPGATVSLYMYYGNANPQLANGPDPKGTYDSDTVLVYHFGSNIQADATGTNNADNPGGKVEAAMIGGGMRLMGPAPVTIPPTPSLAWTDGGTMTWSAWIKPTALQPNAIIFSRREEGKSFLIGLDNGVPFVEVGGTRSSGGEALGAGVWRHLAVVTAGGTITVYLDGVSYGTLSAGLPAMNSKLLIGDDTDGATAFNGEIDEIEISKVARTAGS
jgi:biopolymer transport protein ExbB